MINYYCSSRNKWDGLLLTVKNTEKKYIVTSAAASLKSKPDFFFFQMKHCLEMLLVHTFKVQLVVSFFFYFITSFTFLSNDFLHCGTCLLTTVVLHDGVTFSAVFSFWGKIE